MDGLVFAKLKPVKIVKSAGINYGNKAIENHLATHTYSNFLGDCAKEDTLNPYCSPSLIYNYTYPSRLSFYFLVNDLADSPRYIFNYKNPPTGLSINHLFNSVTRADSIFTFSNDFIQF